MIITNISTIIYDRTYVSWHADTVCTLFICLFPWWRNCISNPL